MSLRKIWSVCLVVFLATFAKSYGDTLASYFTEGSTGTDNTAERDDRFTANNLVPNGGVQADGLWRHSYLAEKGSGSTFSYTGDVGATSSDAFSVSVDCAAGYQVKLETLSFKIAHQAVQKAGDFDDIPEFQSLTLGGGSMGSGEKITGKISVPSLTISLYAVVDGVDKGLVSSVVPTSSRYFTDSADYSVSFDLSRFSFSDNVTFRVQYSLGNDSISTDDFKGRLNLTDVVLTGQAIPEPSSALLGFAGVEFCFLKRKRR